MLKRRDFLKLTGVSGTLAASGCVEDLTRTLIPFLNPPEDIVPGRSTWYATTCRQCPAGCGVLARNREARIVKLEGNPDHPINKGRLCARGQAGLQDLYSPDRLASPISREGGRESRLGWDAALEKFRTGADKAGGRIAVLSGLEEGFRADLLRRWLGQYGSSRILFYEPISYDALREGHRIAFGLEAVPTYDISRCDFILSLGADFLETWVSPVELTRQFTEARDPKGPKARFIYAGPRLSLTGAAADRWIALRAGAEKDFAFALLTAVAEIGLPSALPEGDRAKLFALLADFKSRELAGWAGVDHTLVRALADRIASARRPVVLCDGCAEAVAAAALINAITGAASDSMDFSQPHTISKISGLQSIRQLIDELSAGEIRMLVVHRSNPVYALPGFAEAITKVPFVATIDSVRTETAAESNLVLPVHTGYEWWDSYAPRKGLIGLVQPTMGPVTDSRPMERILGLAPTVTEPEEARLPFLRHTASKLDLAGVDDIHRATLPLLAKGFACLYARTARDRPPLNLEGFTYLPGEGSEGLSLLTYPDLRWFDGRDADKPWLLEIPDPLTMITWDGWIEVHPDRAERDGLVEGDVVEISTPGGVAKAAVHVYPGLHPDSVAIPIGLGRAGFSGQSDGADANPLMLTGGSMSCSGVTLTKTGRRVRLANVDGSKIQHGRGIARATYAPGGREPGAHGGAHHHDYPLRLPIASAHDPKLDIYPPHEHDRYRWGMAIDLDRCTGCSACVAACYAENNVAAVGRDRVLEGREMAWLRIERYFEPGENPKNPEIRFIPMLCQHCDDAPCETVCPVYAPHHNKEGMNAQIYNRCVGTRFCSQNCPYKVRRFNFFHYRPAPPLEMQLNPDVTVRTKGVMEKCSFCVQRIKEAHQQANLEKRRIRDGEVTPACAQTCPAGAITFGSFLDAGSRLMKLAGDERAYQVLGELHTKPGVIYLKKIIRNDGLG